VYEDMFKAGFRFPFPMVVQELLHYLQIAPHQLTPNTWKVFFTCVIMWPKALGEGKNLSVREFLKIYKLSEVFGAEYLFNFQERQPTKFIRLTGRSTNKVWRKRFFFAQGDWKFSMTKIIKDPSVPRETHLPSIARREEPILNQDEENRINQLWKYTHGDPSKMNFDVIFSLTTLAAYLRYPLGDELLPKGSRVQLTRKRNGIDPKTSRLPLPEEKKSKVSSKVLPTMASEPSKHSHLQLSLSKEMAFPRKSRYDKGKHKVNQNLLEDPPLVGPIGPLRAKDGKRKTVILDLLTGTRPSREIIVPIKESNPLIIPSREITIHAEESNPLVIPSLGVSLPPLPSSATNPIEPLR
jgi:hypothetical protein